jgi:hypothetical protein
MANRVYIDIIGTNIMLSAVCSEDINVQAVSQFTRISDLVPGMNELVGLITTYGGVLNGEVKKAMGQVQNALDIPIWSKTEPVKLPIDLNFFLKTSGYEDVWRPTMVLQSMCVLSRSADGTSLITPGFNANTIGHAGNNLGNPVKPGEVKKLAQKAEGSTSNASQLMKEEDDLPKTFASKSKLCSVYIPGIVYMPIAILESIQVTWSKQLTNKGYPIWAKVNCQFTGSFPAVFEDNFLSVNPNTVKNLLISGDILDSERG